jgi:predicted protein tyrosine phosphatase
MNKTNILFICTGNRDRSPTAEEILEKDPAFSVRSAGTSKSAVTVVSIEDVQWADLIFVMEQKHKDRICAEFPRVAQYKTFHVLGISNDYKYMDPRLVEELKSKLSKILDISL